MLIAMSEEDRVSKDKSPSPELFEMIQAAANNLMSFGGLWNSIKKKGHDEGFSERELEDMLRPLLKPQLNKDQIYYLFHTEEKKEQSRQSYHRNIPTVAPKKDTGQNKGNKDKPPEIPPPPPEDEEPTPLELAQIEIQQLKEALHKSQQFIQANQLQAQPQQQEPATDEHYFKFLTDRADGVSSFYYDSYGIDLFKNRELSQLKNSGVKVFKRLYFEV
jgi:hypothetical protein